MTNLTDSTILTTLLSERTLYILRRSIEQRGYTIGQADYGLTWACGQGFVAIEDGVALAMSRILFSDDELNEGVRYS